MQRLCTLMEGALSKTSVSAERKKRSEGSSAGPKAGTYTFSTSLKHLAAGGGGTGAEVLREGIFLGAAPGEEEAECDAFSEDREGDGTVESLDEGPDEEGVGNAGLMIGVDKRLHHHNENDLWGQVLRSVSSFRALSKKERMSRFREAFNEFSLSDKYLGYLADFYWGSISLTKFLPSSLRGAPEEEGEEAEIRVMPDGRAKVVTRRSKSAQIGWLDLRAPEWQRAILTFFIAHGKVVSPVFALWGMRYITWFLEFMDEGYSWVALLKGEHAARRSLGDEFRTLPGRSVALGQRFWGVICDNAMRHRLTINPGYKAYGKGSGDGKNGKGKDEASADKQ